MAFGLGLCVLLVSCAFEQAVERAALPVAAEPVPTVATDRQRFAQAHGWLRDEEYGRALEAFTRLASTYPQLGDYHLYYIGFIQARRGEIDAAQTALTRLLADYPESVKADDASLELGRLLLQRREYATAATFLERAAGSDRDSVRDAGRLAMARLAEQRGDITGAYGILMAIRRGAPGTSVGREAKKGVARLRRLYRQLEPQGTALYDEVKLLLDERDYAGAAAALERLQKAPPPGVDPVAMGRLEAETLLGQGRFDDGLAALWEIADDHPRSSAAPAALFRLSSLLWNRDRDAAALRAFGELRTRYPRDRRVPDALYAIARIHDSAGRESEAVEAYEVVVRRFPRSELAAESRWRIGWIHYRARRWDEAAVAFAELAESTRGKRHDEAMYWRARTHDNAGRDARARQLYGRIVSAADGSPYGAYYAAWAEARLRGSSSPASAAPFAPDGSESITVPTRSVPLAPPSLPRFHVDRWRELAAAGLNELARPELVAIERDGRGDGDTARFLIAAYQEVDDFRRARALAARTGRAAGLTPRERRELLYPLAFWEDVRLEATARRVDPIWVVALMRQESMFDPDARSPADARGLMQLLPSTAKRVASEMGNSEQDIDLTRPLVNIRLGIAYLHSLSDRFGGDMLKALAAYNAGEAAADRWQQQFGALAHDEFVESITYRETRDYVKRVAGNYRIYREVYASAPP